MSNNQENSYSPEVYTEEQLDVLEKHIQENFGTYDNVFHEIVSPDIHVDIALIAPTPERNYYTLVTMGMGAHEMNVPSELDEYKLKRAEMMICLPPDWDINGSDERWYWPLRWLKIMARLPIENDTWLGWAHTVPNGEPFADNTQLTTILLTCPVFFGEDSFCCDLPDGDQVNFYQMVPLYEEEVAYKLAQGAEPLLEALPDEAWVVDINRPVAEVEVPEEVPAIPVGEVKDLLTDWEEGVVCLASKRIVVDGQPVGYMQRTELSDEDDSGWMFFAGDEEDEYLQDTNNVGVYHLNTLCNYSPDIIPLLRAPYGTSYMRDEEGNWEED